MRFRAAVFARHIGQTTSACLIAMTQGDLTTITFSHWVTALHTGIGAGFIGVLMTFGPLISIQTNRYGVASVAFISTVIADLLSHPTHFGFFAAEALVTGVGAGLLCLGASFTPLGKAIEKLNR